MTEFNPFEMCRILNEEKVDYVVLGGFAANLRGSPITTRDLDVIPDPTEENLDRLGRAGSYEGWRSSATFELIDEGLVVSVASLHDIIDSKQTANRAKDHVALPYPESLRDEIRRQVGE